MTEQVKDETASSKNALIFEMDNVALGARRVRFEVLKGIFAEQGITFTPAQFSRYCMHSSPAHYMTTLLNVLNVQSASAAQVLERMMNDVVAYMLNHRRNLQTGLVRFLDAAKESGMDIATISMFSSNVAEELAEQMNFSRWGVRIYCFPQVEKNFPTADTWLEIIRSVSKKPRCCLALTSSMSSAKAALAAGMRVAALPDDFTSYQDFSGADLVTENIDDVNVKTFFEQIRFG